MGLLWAKSLCVATCERGDWREEVRGAYETPLQQGYTNRVWAVSIGQDELLSDSESADSANARLAYAKMASDQAALLLNRNYTAEAEQAFQLGAVA